MSDFTFVGMRIENVYITALQMDIWLNKVAFQSETTHVCVFSYCMTLTLVLDLDLGIMKTCLHTKSDSSYSRTGHPDTFFAPVTLTLTK